MGVAYYPSFERAVNGFDPSVEVSGKAVAHAMDQLEKICQALGVPGLMSFYSESNEEAFEKIGEEVPPGMRENPIKWSDPSIGLRTLSGLVEHFSKYPDELENSQAVVQDLQSFQRVLEVAGKHHVRFRLRIDI